MPTYEYACTKCGQHFDLFQSFTDEPLKKHAGCGGKLNKVLGSVGIVLKGSGFYKTDSRAASRASKKKSDAASESKVESKSDTGSGDAKPANGSGSTTSDAKPADGTSGSKPAGSSGEAKSA